MAPPCAPLPRATPLKVPQFIGILVVEPFSAIIVAVDCFRSCRQDITIHSDNVQLFDTLVCCVLLDILHLFHSYYSLHAVIMFTVSYSSVKSVVFQHDSWDHKLCYY